ncbi:RluA family pseudouridine synthase [bacterium]|nr:RluA family pseudouridine synthase [bacterium]
MKHPDIPADGVNRITLEVEEGYGAAERLDVLITNRLPKISRSRVKRLIEEHRVQVDGRTAKPSLPVAGGMTIVVEFPHPPRPPAVPEPIPLDVVYEDEHLLVVNKPAGMVVHPAAGHHSGTLVNALLHRFANLPLPEVYEPEDDDEDDVSDEETPEEADAVPPVDSSGLPRTHRPGIVHRLDKDTSGLLVVARTETMMTALGRLFHEHDIEREYHALVWGSPPDSGTIDAPISRHPGDRKRFAVVEGGREAVTRFLVAERFEFACLLSLRLETGRTHQIRVHTAHKGWPVFGDGIYGGTLHGLSQMTSFQRDLARRALKEMPRQALHARTLGFVHPETGERMHFEAPYPNDFRRTIELLRG